MVEPGTLTTARPQLVCGKCGPCSHGDYNVCEELAVQGFQAPRCAQDYFITVPERFVPLSSSLSVEQRALVEGSDRPGSPSINSVVSLSLFTDNRQYWGTCNSGIAKQKSQDPQGPSDSHCSSPSHYTPQNRIRRQAVQQPDCR